MSKHCCRCELKLIQGKQPKANANSGGYGEGSLRSPSMPNSAMSSCTGNKAPPNLRDTEHRSNQNLSDAAQRSVCTGNLLANHHVAPATINRRRQQQQINAGNERIMNRLARIAKRLPMKNK